MGNVSSHLNTEREDIILLLATLELLISQQEEEDALLEALLVRLGRDEKLNQHRQKRSSETGKVKRKTFSEITGSLSERSFRRMFRMARPSRQ